MVWLVVMALFPLALLLLQFNRGRLPRKPRTSLLMIFLTLAVAVTITGGNVALDPTTVGYAAAYVVVLALLLSLAQKKWRLLHWAYWVYDQSPMVHRWKVARKFKGTLLRAMRWTRRRPVGILVKTDEVSTVLVLLT
jgi:hypothetical protein